MQISGGGIGDDYTDYALRLGYEADLNIHFNSSKFIKLSISKLGFRPQEYRWNPVSEEYTLIKKDESYSAIRYTINIGSWRDRSDGQALFSMQYFYVGGGAFARSHSFYLSYRDSTNGIITTHKDHSSDTNLLIAAGTGWAFRINKNVSIDIGVGYNLEIYSIPIRFNSKGLAHLIDLKAGVLIPLTKQ